MPDPKIEQALDEVLRSDDLTSRHFHYRKPSDTVVDVVEVREHVKRQVGNVADLSEQVDAAVSARGGEKLEVVDLKQKVKNLGLRMTGRSPHPEGEMYLIPARGD